METQNRQNTPKELRNWTVKKRTFCAALTLALSLILAYPSGAAYETPTFSDVPKSHWSYAYVEQAAEQKWAAGNPDGSFSPNTNVTYAQFCVMLGNAFFPKQLAGYTGPASPWYAPACTIAARNGLLANTSVENTFDQKEAVSQNICRYEMAQMLYSVMQAKDWAGPVEQAAVQADTADWSSIPSRYRDAVAAVKSAGIISGIDREGRFAGDGAMTRAQAAVVLCRSALPTTAGTRRSLPEEIICQSPATWLSGPGRANHTPTST